MAAIDLPSKPSVPDNLYTTGKDGEKELNQEAMLKYQQRMADYNFALQTMQQMQNEEQATRTNMSKSSHDAMMAVITNLKA